MLWLPLMGISGLSWTHYELLQKWSIFKDATFLRAHVHVNIKPL